MDETIKIFISSRQDELKEERAWASKAVREAGQDLNERLEPILVEHKAAPPSTTIHTQCHEELKGCRAVICVYYKTISDIVKNEFLWANERGIPIFIFKKDLQEGEKTDKELEEFIREKVKPTSREPEGPYGTYVYKPFRGEDIKDKIKVSLKDYRKKGFNFKPIPEKYLPSKAWPGKLEIIRKVYVKPHCYPEAEEKLKNNRLLIITGPAHLGKTSMAFYLADTLQKNNISQRFLIFPDKEDLSEIASFHDSVILFDDPFGGAIYQASFIGDRFYKIEELACKNHIIITSRREVLNVAKSTKLGERNLEDRTLEMRQVDYSDGDFGEILAKHLEYFEADLSTIALTTSHKEEIIRELRFPHNYERFVGEEIKKVVKKGKDFQQALKDAKEIERAVGNWFEGWYSKNKELFYFLLTLTLCGELEEEDFVRLHKEAINRLNKKRNLCLPIPGNLSKLQKDTASYVSQSGLLRLEHPSYKEGILGSIEGSYTEDAFIILKEMAKDKESSVRSSATRILGEIGKKHPKEVLPVLKDLTEDESLDVRFYTVLALGAMGDKHPQKVLPILKNLVRHEEAGVRSRTALALGKMGKKNPTKIIPILGTLAEDKVSYVRCFTAEALGEIGKEHPINVLPILKELAEDEDPNVLSRTVRILGEVGNKFPKEVVPVLEELVWTKGYPDTIEVLRDIGKIHPGEILPILQNLIEDDDPDVYLRAAEAFVGVVEVGKEHREEALPILEEMGNHEDPNVRYITVRALKEIANEHPKEVLPILQKLGDDEDPNVNSLALKVLMSVETYQIKAEITTSNEMVGAEEEVVEEPAEEVLPFLNREDFNDLNCPHAEEVLSILERQAEDENRDVRYNAAENLREVGKLIPTEVIPILKKLAGDKDDNVRSLAEEVIRELRFEQE